MASCSLTCDPLSVTSDRLETSSAVSSSSHPPAPQLRPRRRRRVLYPAFQSRRPPLQEAPDRARRCLLVLSALLFLQIYCEDAHACPECVADLQNQSPEPAPCSPQQAPGGEDGTRGWNPEEPWRLQTVVDSEHQTCVVL